MTTIDLPPAPPFGPFGPDNPHVEFALVECRDCGERSDWIPIVRDKDGTIVTHPAQWHTDHFQKRGDAHARSYQYAFTRHTAELWTPQLARRRPKSNDI